MRYKARFRKENKSDFEIFLIKQCARFGMLTGCLELVEREVRVVFSLVLREVLFYVVE